MPLKRVVFNFLQFLSPQNFEIMDMGPFFAYQLKCLHNLSLSRHFPLILAILRSSYSQPVPSCFLFYIHVSKQTSQSSLAVLFATLLFPQRLSLFNNSATSSTIIS
jgi:hypothetical protein